jgi:dTDP-glucose pyrophosphorylase
MQVVVPMAGRGSRYASEGYVTPKPLVEVAGKPMFYWALQSLKDLKPSKCIFIILAQHEKEFGVSGLISGIFDISTQPEFVLLEDFTEGQLCTVLAAKHLFDPEQGLLIASSDTMVESNLGADIKQDRRDGLISVAKLPGEQWSFARINDDGDVVEVAEKVRISDLASTGLYFFRRAKDLIEHGEAIIERKEKTRGEYYVIPVYQSMIRHGKKVGVSMASAMWDMGTPDSKARFEQHLQRLS